MKKQKWLVSGDWQLDSNPPFDVKKDGHSMRFEDSVQMVEQTLDMGKKAGATHLFFLGDATEHKQASSLERTMLAHLFKSASGMFEQIYAIPGNHDGSLFNLSSSTVEPYGVLLPNFSYFDKFTYREMGMNWAAFLPYLHGVPEIEIAVLIDRFIESIPRGRNVFLFGHYGVAGAASGANNLILEKDVLSRAALRAAQFTKIFMGHIHKAQILDNVVFPGSTYCHDFGERNDEKGFILYEPDTDTITKCGLQPRHKLVQVFVGDIVPACSPEAIVKVVGEIAPGDWDSFKKTQMTREDLYKEAGAAVVFWEVEMLREERFKRSEITIAHTYPQMLDAFLQEYFNADGPEQVQADEDFRIMHPRLMDKGIKLLEEQEAYKPLYGFIELERITFTNFLTFVNETFEFTKGIHLISAPNGTGKSNALGGLFFALTGKTMTDVNLSALIRQGSDLGVVALEFKAGGDHYKLARQIMKKTSGGANQKIFLTCNGKNLKDGGNTDAQDQTTRLLGLDSLAFRNSIFFVQDDPGNIVSLGSRDRKQVISSILKIDILQLVFKRIGALTQELRRDQDLLIVKKQTLEGMKFEKSREEMEEEVKGLNNKIVELENEISQAQQNFEALGVKLKAEMESRIAFSAEMAKLSDLTALPGRLQVEGKKRKELLEQNLNNLRKRRDDIKTQVPILEAELIKLKTEAASLEDGRLFALKEKEETLKKKKDGLDKEADTQQDETLRFCGLSNALRDGILRGNEIKNLKTCPTCNQKVEHLHSEIEKHQNEMVLEKQKIDEQIDYSRAHEREIRARIVQAQSDIYSVLGEQRQSGEQKARAEEQVKNTQEKIELLKGELEKVVNEGKNSRGAFDKELEEQAKVLAEAEEKAKQAKDKFYEISRLMDEAVAEAKKLEQEQVVKKNQIDRVKITVSGYQTQVAVLDSQLKQLLNLAGDLKEVEKKLDALTLELGDYDILKDAFGPSGIPTRVLESMIPEMEKRINQYLTALGAPDFRVFIETQVESESTGATKETFELFVDNGKVPALDVRSYSGGQKQLMEIAIHLALAEIASSRSGVRFPFYVFDETYDGLDAQKQQALTRLIFNLPADLVLVTCHIQEVVQQFDDVLELTYTEEEGTKFHGSKRKQIQEPAKSTK